MRKKIFSLCMALALCLALLPATALAAGNAPSTLIVGNMTIGTSYNGYWTTNNGTLTSSNESSWNVRYDTSTNTLYLNGATITASNDSNNNTSNAGIYATASEGQSVSLNIVLQGENNKVSGDIGIYVYSSSTGIASLTISSEDGSNLTASGTVNPGIWVQSNSGNAALTIQNADVTAENSISSGDGVIVQAGSSSPASLSVDGGSLTATGKSENGAGIRYTFGSSNSGSGKPSLTVSGNAMVKASGGEGGISDNSSTDIQIGKGQNSSGGIVFNGNEGTVYGSVTLQDDLTIDDDESLTIGEDASLTIPEGITLTNEGNVTNSGTLTNNGTINNSGTLPDNIEGTAPPRITTTSLDGGAVGTAYNATLGASGENITWTWAAVTGSNTPPGLTLNTDTGEISGTPTAAGTYSFTVTATNSGGTDSEQLSITISSATNIPVQSVSLDKTSLGLTEGGTAQLTATVKPDNATNKDVTWESSDTSIATVDASGKVTAISAGSATLTATTQDGRFTATCTVTVTAPPEPEPEPEPTPPPYIPPSKPNWTSVARKLANAQPGDTVTVKMNGEAEVPGDVWETIAGRDVTVILDMGGNVSWTVDGNDVPTATHFADMDFGVDRNTTGIDVDVINAITGQVSSVQITLAHDGEFGFTLTLTAPLGRENAGSWANLYHYNEDAESLSYETSSEIQEDGTASLKMTHASQYAIIIDEQTHQLPFEDVASGTWYEGAVRYAYLHDIMEGMSATTFQPNGTLSRAMAVQIFYNLEGQPDISDENLGYPYEDVNAQAWYGDAVYWARITGVATGYGDGTFQPTDSITRQEFAQMLYNYAEYKGYDLSAEGDLSQFPDSGSVADWAEAAMSWANGNQLINGHDNGTIDAGGTAIRAQAASILMRFDENVTE